MNCKFCGQPVEDGKKFCTSCGAPVDNPIPDIPASQNTSFPEIPQTVPASVGKNGVSKKKTVFFWASKAAVVAALILFFLPFISFDYHGNLRRGSTDELVLTGKELIFGNEDSNDGDSAGTAKDNLSSGTVMLAGIAALIALVLPKHGAYASGSAAYLLFRFSMNADKSYTFRDKPVRDWSNDILEMNVHAALYIAAALFTVSTVLAAIDYYQRRRMFKDDLMSTLNGGGYSSGGYGYI